MFEKGNKLGPGRPPGSQSEITKIFHQRLLARNFSSADALVDVYEMGLMVFREGHHDHKTQGLAIAAQMAKEIASYQIPKLKSVEVIGSNEYASMTTAQKLEYLKKAIPLLEKKVQEEQEQASKPVVVELVKND